MRSFDAAITIMPSVEHEQQRVVLGLRQARALRVVPRKQHAHRGDRANSTVKNIVNPSCTNMPPKRLRFIVRAGHTANTAPTSVISVKIALRESSRSPGNSSSSSSSRAPR